MDPADYTPASDATTATALAVVSEILRAEKNSPVESRSQAFGPCRRLDLEARLMTP